MTGVMSTPMPSPSMNGTIGLSGTGCPVTSFAPPSGTWISVVVLIRESYRHRMEIAQRIAEALLDGFDRHYTLCRATTRRTREGGAGRRRVAAGEAALRRLADRPQTT